MTIQKYRVARVPACTPIGTPTYRWRHQTTVVGVPACTPIGTPTYRWRHQNTVVQASSWKRHCDALGSVVSSFPYG